MQTIEPYFHWRDYYRSEDDPRSPFFGMHYSEFEYSNTIYNHFIHPQWDSIDSESLYVKVLYVNYEEAFCFIELLGEWNDILHNDIMYLKQNLLELLLEEGVNKIILIGRNVLNFHGDADDYYQELSEDMEDGFVIGLQFQEHVLREFTENGLQNYIFFLPKESEANYSWSTKKPEIAFRDICQLFID